MARRRILDPEDWKNSRSQYLAAKLGSAERYIGYSGDKGSFFTTRDWFNGKNYGEALLEQAIGARGNGRPKIAKAYERMARNNGATATQFKDYRARVRELGLANG